MPNVDVTGAARPALSRSVRWNAGLDRAIGKARDPISKRRKFAIKPTLLPKVLKKGNGAL